MRRADRLLMIVQILRRTRGPVAASRIAEELEVSLRTLYRDMAALESTGVPIRGEAGVGYVLEPGYDLPPLMFSVEELEALVLGARMVDARGDEALARTARDALAKIAAVVPKNLSDRLIDAPLFAPNFDFEPPDTRVLREAMRREEALAIAYLDLSEKRTTRTVWPVCLSFFADAVVMVAWCTLRGDFRTFRVDRIEVADPAGPMPRSRRTLFHEWSQTQKASVRADVRADVSVRKRVRGVS